MSHANCQQSEQTIHLCGNKYPKPSKEKVLKEICVNNFDRQSSKLRVGKVANRETVLPGKSRGAKVGE